MKNFYRINEEQMDILALHMNDVILKDVNLRFTPCTPEEFVVLVFQRGGISRDAVEEVLNVDLEEVKDTCEVIHFIKGYMICYNYVHKAKIRFPERDFVTEDSAEGEEYRFHLFEFFNYYKVLKDMNQGSFVLTDFSNSFPEIDTVFTEDRLLYTWKGNII